MSRMGFVSAGDPDADPPTAEESAAWQRRSSPPDNELPVGVPLSAVLGRSEAGVVAVVGLYVHRGGVAFDVSVRLRHPERQRNREVFDVISGSAAAGQQLLIGIEYADGRRVSTIDLFEHDRTHGADVESVPSLVPCSGGGGGGRWDQQYWLTPLPPPGPVTIVCSCAALEIPESQTVLVDGADLAAASEQVEELWPWEPEPPYDPRPTDLDLPDGSWFSDRDG